MTKALTFSNVLYKRLLPHVEKVIGWYQCGFLGERSTIDQIHALRQIFNKTIEYSIGTCYLFIHFRAVCDSINDQKLYKTMEEFEILTKLINLTKATLKRVKCRVKLGNDLSEVFYIVRSLQQVDALFCLYFNLALKKAISTYGLKDRKIIYHQTIEILPFADNITLMGRSRKYVVELFILLEAEARKLDLTINEGCLLKEENMFIKSRDFAQNSKAALSSAFRVIKSGPSSCRYICPFCTKGFKNKTDMERHLRVHTGSSIAKLRPSRAEIEAEVVFILNESMPAKDTDFNERSEITLSSYLRVNKLVPSLNRYSCSFCGKGFMYRAHMERHLLVHSDKKTYKCEICSKCYKHSDSLSYHCKTAHRA
ncbi:zinc finger protein 680-like [Stegodyphus dumicola]|uniref:zinc finger protein 680-like n=1 Tax=Stegodyphus dumicola TaxID=202533 RepID=UPI0015B1681A|nr:zinc finger protein 680-like [Stegodyphus dumicola]